MLLANGADAVFFDKGSIAEEVRKKHPEGFSKILELVGVTVLEDSLKCAKEQGIVCITEIAGGKVGDFLLQYPKYSWDIEICNVLLDIEIVSPFHLSNRTDA
jgi:NADPH:quinone reductase-like Zn-dependent oxidoreductase